jgi:hypothetical protein
LLDFCDRHPGLTVLLIGIADLAILVAVIYGIVQLVRWVV